MSNTKYLFALAMVVMLTGCDTKPVASPDNLPDVNVPTPGQTNNEANNQPQNAPNHNEPVAECRQGADCRTPEKPICSSGICVACSAEHACYQGFCDTATGRCVDCLTSDDCPSRENGICASNVCVSCNASNCTETCNEMTGKCGPRVVLPCPGGNCGVPSPVPPIDPIVFPIPPIEPPVVIVPRIEVAETAPTIGSYKVDARVNGLFATVSTEFTIVNANQRVLEGELNFPLPEGAVVSGYAIDINGVMADASVVEKKKARIAFENEVKKGIDPGLVEQVKGNAYKTRIYPIPANGSRRIRVDYTTPLTIAPNGDAALSLPMPKTKLHQRDISISVVAANMPAPALGGLGDTRFTSAEAVWRVESHDTNVENAENILVAMPKLPDVVTSIEHEHGDIYFAASVNIAAKDTANVAMPSNFRLVWDASGSRKPADVAAARKVLEALPETASYELHVFRNVLDAARSFKSRQELLAFVDTLVYDGGTDFDPLKPLAAQKFDGMTLFFTDGIDTINGALPEFGASSMALVSGAVRDIPSMRKICGGRTLNLDIVKPEEVLREMTTPSPVVASVKGDNLSNIQGIGASAVGRVTVLGRMTSLQSKAVLELSDGRTIPLVFPADVTGGKTLATSWASRRVEDLSPNADLNRDELLALGRRFSLVSPVSSMIVLDNIEQYLEYDIEPNEKLTELHAQWLDRRPSDGQRESDERMRAEDWHQKLMREWESRIAWWNDPIPPKGMFKKSESHRGGGFLGALFGGEAREDSMMAESAVMEDSEPMDEPALARVADAMPMAAAPNDESLRSADASVTVKAWDPNTPYLQAIKDAQTIFKTPESGYNEYIKQRQNYASSPAFYFDCASYFFNQNAPELATRILSNLSELSIDDVAMLRVYAWRLREAGQLDFALIILRKVAKLRPDEALSWRDLALTLAMRAKKNLSPDDTQEALEYFHKAAFTPFLRDDALWTALVALEEFNELANWSKRQKWTAKTPVIPSVDEKFLRVLDTDLRIVMTWDADSTDIDMHVVEPSGEEVFYSHQRSRTGALISHDVTTGYGPEEFLHKVAPKGKYEVSTKYFASHQQSLIGPATITVTYFTNWGRENQESHSMSLRLDKQKDKVVIGTIDVNK